LQTITKCHSGLSWCVGISADKHLTWRREEVSVIFYVLLL